MTLADRFWAKVDKTETCWLWTGALDDDGYGRCNTGATGRTKLAHRIAYEFVVGPIPEGLVLDHVQSRGCLNKACVNPAHLEPVSDRENRLRNERDIAVRNAKVTHCPHGHEYTPDNTYWERKKHGLGRKCRTCVKAKDARRRAVSVGDAPGGDT